MSDPSAASPLSDCPEQNENAVLATATEDGYLTIGALARLCGVTVRTLRYYEEMDLIGPVKRTGGKYRLYNRYSLKRVKAIIALQALNYSLDEVLVTLGPFSKSRDFTREEQVEATRRSLRLQKNAIDVKLEQLNTMREELTRRLHILDTICEPCQVSHPHDGCQERCQFLETHY